MTAVEARTSAPSESSPVDKHGQIRNTGKKYTEQNIAFGPITTKDQPYIFTLTLSDIYGSAQPLPTIFSLELKSGVQIVTSGDWRLKSTVEPDHQKPQTGSFDITDQVSSQASEALQVGLSVAVGVSAEPLGVGVSTTVTASLDYTNTHTTGRSSSTTTTLNYDLALGQGGQGWALGGKVTASIPWSSLVLPGKSAFNPKVFDPDLSSLKWVSDPRYPNGATQLEQGSARLAAIEFLIARSRGALPHGGPTLKVTTDLLTPDVAQTSFRYPAKE